MIRTAMLLTGMMLAAPFATHATAEEPAAAPAATAPATPAAEAPAAKAVKATAPALLVDVGQGNSAKLVEALLKRAKTPIPFDYKPMATAADLGSAKSVIVGVGASSKGLGAAGLDLNTETARATELLKAAKDAGLTIIGVHIGGLQRRGEASDGLNRLVAENASVMIVWKEGEEDGFFTRICGEKKVPLHIVERKPDVGAKLESLYAAEEPAKAE